MKKLLFLIGLLLMQSINLYAVTADELMAIHKVTTTEMNNISTPQAGSLVYNTTENAIFFYTGAAWKKLRSDGDETIINAGSSVTVTGNGTSATPYTVGSN